MTKYTLCVGSGGGNNQVVENLVFRGPGCFTSPVLKTFGSAKKATA